ncbi:hypothetical protein C7N43_03905 [Sphingobacteriales bacterium UPWRP_1]|nr:hypothetical protein B6N25_05545 [Sphingobacteriales bacterium TSM_CSS]PSJ78355.1 hypothetical protein C7N43_03905 [Sphingobacteriales bacterium UPWRP_1]
MRILLTGFGKFGYFEQNPTEIIVNGFKNRFPEVSVSGHVLEVNFNTVPLLYAQILQQIQPQFIVNLGLAAETPVLQLEKVALNTGFDAYSDKTHFALQPNAPDAYFSSLPVEDIARYLCQNGIPALRSNHAGHYLCNMLYYLSLQWCAQQGNCQALFVHLPFTTQLAAQICMQQHRAYPSLPQPVAEQAIALIIDWYLKYVQQPA